MGKGKLQKFDDMNGYSHVFQYPFAVLKEEGFPMKGSWGKEFFMMVLFCQIMTLL